MANFSIFQPQIQSLSSALPNLTLVLLICFSFLGLVICGVIANVQVCRVLVRGRRFKKHLSNFMLFHLSITDLIYRLVVVPGFVAAKYFPVRNRSELFCKFADTCLYTVYTAVFSSLVVIAFDRHQSITKPFQHLRRKPKFFRWILVVWGYSTVCALPQFSTMELVLLLLILPIIPTQLTFFRSASPQKTVPVKKYWQYFISFQVFLCL